METLRTLMVAVLFVLPFVAIPQTSQAPTETKTAPIFPPELAAQFKETRLQMEKKQLELRAVQLELRAVQAEMKSLENQLNVIFQSGLVKLGISQADLITVYDVKEDEKLGVLFTLKPPKPTPSPTPKK